MGIRFRCHHCEHELNVKDFLAGKRGKCPNCNGKFRIPVSDSTHSLPVESPQPTAAQRSPSEAPQGPERPSSEDAPSIDESQRVDLTTADPAATRGSATSTKQQPLGQSAVSTRSEDFQKDDKISSERPTPETVGDSQAQSVPPALVDGANATWYVRIADGNQFGPATGDILLQWMGENRIQPDSLVWRDGWEQWQLASEAFADYFGQRQVARATPERVQEQAANRNLKTESAALPPTSLPDLPSGGQQITMTSLAQDDHRASSVSGKSRLDRRLRRRRNYRLTISFLSIAAVLLIVTLVIVLIVQQQ